MTRILLVTDSPWVVDTVKAALPDDEVAVVADSATAVARVLETDVAIMDFQVGAMGGMAIARAVRAAARVAEVTPPPTLLLLDREADAFLAGRAGVDGWIRKPFGSFALRRLLEQVVATGAHPSAGS